MLRRVLLLVLGIMILGSFFYAGLYWHGQRWAFQLLVTPLLIAVLLLCEKGSRGSFWCQTDILGGVVVLLYVIGIYRPASTFSALMTALLWISYFAVYLAFRRLVRTEAEKKALLVVLLGFCALVAILGLAVYTETISMQDALIGGRLSVLLQYPNATASIFVLGATIALASLPHLRVRLKRMAVFLSLVLLLPALYLTYSRGGWLAFLVAVGVICLWQGRIWVVLHYLTGATIAGILIVGVLQTSPEPLAYLAMFALAVPFSWLYTLVPPGSRGVKIAFAAVLLTVLAVAGYLGWAPVRYNLTTVGLPPAQVLSFEIGQIKPNTEYVVSGRATVSGTPATPPASLVILALSDGQVVAQLGAVQIAESGDIAVTVSIPENIHLIRTDFVLHSPATTLTLHSLQIAGGGVTASLNSPLHRLLPLPLANRLTHMRVQVLLEDGRLTFIRDGLHLARLAPWFGQGGGTWEALYQSVQSYNYASRHAHSEPLEMLLDIGMVGLGIFILFVISILRYSRKGSVIDGVVAVAVSAFLLNSAGEFLGAFPSFYFVLFALLGVLSTNAKPLTLVSIALGFVKGSVIAALVLSLPLLGLTLMAEGALERMQHALQAGDTAAARTLIYRAQNLVPWDPTLRVAMTQLYWFDLAEDRNLRLLLEAGRELEPSNATLAELLAKMAMRHGEHEQAIRKYAAALRLHIMEVSRYADLATAHVAIALRVAGENPAQSLEMARAAIATGESFAARLATLPRPHSLRGSPSLQLALGQAYLLARQYSEAEEYLQLAMRAPDEVTRTFAAVTLGRLYQMQNKTDAAERELRIKIDRLDLERYYLQLVAATR